MTDVRDNCGCGGSDAWALWLDRTTIAFPVMMDRAGASYRLVSAPHVSLTVGDLSDPQKEADRRTKHAHYQALVLSGPSGQPLSAGEVKDLLRGPLLLETVRDGAVIDRGGVQIAGGLADIYAGARAQKLGVDWESGVPTLKLWAPTASSVKLQLWLKDGPKADGGFLCEADRDDDGIWTVVGAPEWEDAEYLWEVRVYVPSVGSLVTNRVTDPYSVGLTVDSTRSVIVNRDRERWKPRAWGAEVLPPLRNAASQAVYELHVRDFSAWDQTVPAELRGTYAAFLQEGSAGRTALEGLADAGITTLHLLPTYDIASGAIPEARSERQQPEVEGIALVPENQGLLEAVAGWSRSSVLPQQAVGEVANQDAFNWGYDPNHWMTPEGSYASVGNQVGGGRTLEYREMVQALHDLGLRVVQDVVFNHTFQCGQGRDSVLDKVVPGYYHRLSPRGEVETSTCCANIATEHVMAEKIMVDAVVDAAVAYRIDGFRFDLMGHHSLSNMEAVRAELDNLTIERDGVDGKSIYLYGEGWNFGEVADDALFTQATQANIGGSGIGVFNDRLRDAVRGGSPMDGDHRSHQGFATGLAVDPNEVQTWQGSWLGGAVDASEAGNEAVAELYRQMDLVKISLIGAIRDYPLALSDGSGTVMSQSIDYFGKGAAFAHEPQECVNYVEAHDDETLFDSAIWKLPLTTSMEDRVKSQVLANATVALGQGVAFWASGTELLRSKSLDRDSYNSGDWFNAIDWTGQWNQFGRGLPSAARNRAHWDAMAPLLEDKSLRPDASAMALCREKSMELLRIRASHPLLTLGSAEQIRRRVRFLPTGVNGADQPGVIAMHIDGRGQGESEDAGLFVLFNATPEEWAGTLQVCGKSRDFEVAPRSAAVHMDRN